MQCSHPRRPDRLAGFTVAAFALLALRPVALAQPATTPEATTEPERPADPPVVPTPEPSSERESQAVWPDRRHNPPAAEEQLGPASAPVDPPEFGAGTGPEPSAPVAPASSGDSAEPAEPGDTFGAVAVAPVPGAQTPLSQVPRGVVQLDASLIEAQHPLGLQEALALRLAGVVLNDVQSNPLQRDLQYRGFTASPLLGTPQGLAVYQNGVRINESFGDVVQWDMVPEIAVAEAQMVPGANPLYGLNALGGSLALRMKNGYRFKGHRLTGSAGSFARYVASGELGKQLDGWAFYGAVSRFGEEGYRKASRSSATRAFADVRRIDASSELGMGVTLADTDLNGNGPVPVELLASEGRSALYTYPDNTQNRLVMVSADLDRDLSEGVSLQGTAYLRHVERDTLNGDEAEFQVCPNAAMVSVLCDEQGEVAISEAGTPIETDVAFDGLYNTSETVTNAYGGSLQLTIEEDLARTPNQLFVGVTYDGGQVAFLQRAEVGFLTPDRTILGRGRFLTDNAFRTQLQARNHYAGVYVADTWTPVPALSLHASGRFSWANVKLLDQGGSSALDGNHHFTRLTPAAGVTYSPLQALNLFASYAESNRVPSAAELACADPDEPCRVPNAFVTDPPLEQVVSRSGELGVRGQVGPGRRPLLRYSVAGFLARNFNDILFVAGSRVGTGYFRNAGKTQRMGLEVDISGQLGPVRFFAGYALLRATFESDLSLPGGAHPALAGDADDDDGGPGPELAVSPGDRISGLPAHSFKAGVSLRPLARWELGVSLIARSGAPYRGDEANLLEDQPGYATVGAYTSYDLLDELQLFLKAQNLFDSEYETFGVLAAPDEVLPGTSNPRFVSPGAPLAVFAGLVVHDD